MTRVRPPFIDTDPEAFRRVRVLFQSHYKIGRMYGGGPSVIYNFAAGLGGLGVEVTFHDYWRHNPKDFDLVHYFSCYDAFNWLRRAPDDPPLVVTPITWYDFPYRKRAESHLKYAFQVLRHRTRDRGRLGDPFVIPAHWFPNSEGEAYHFGRSMGVPRSKMTIIPHGVPRRFLEGDPTSFERTYGLRDFVLCVGRFEHPRKNQLSLIRGAAPRGSAAGDDRRPRREPSVVLRPVSRGGRAEHPFPRPDPAR